MNTALQQEVDTVDTFIETLGNDGVRFLRQLQKTGVTTAEASPDVPLDAYYNTSSNCMHLDPGLKLSLLFNYRVHEGTHAIHTAPYQDIQNAINNRGLSAADFFKLRRAMEINAHYVQAYFCILAAHKTGDSSFLNAVTDNVTTRSYAIEMEQLTQNSCDPAEAANHMAQQIITFPVEACQDVPEIEKYAIRTLGDTFDFTVARQLCSSPPQPQTHKIPREILKSILTAVVPLRENICEEIMHTYIDNLDNLHPLSSALVQHQGYELS